jgi:hypothetical protein
MRKQIRNSSPRSARFGVVLPIMTQVAPLTECRQVQ